METQEVWEDKVKFVLCYEGYSPEHMASVLPRIHELGFVRIATHVGFCKVNGGLRDNTIYFKCEFEGYKDSRKTASFSKSITVVPLELSDPAILEGNWKHPSIEKDIIFIGQWGLMGVRKVGWYNRERNILWLPDLLHYPKSGEKEGWVAFDKVLTALE